MLEAGAQLADLLDGLQPALRARRDQRLVRRVEQVGVGPPALRPTRPRSW